MKKLTAVILAFIFTFSFAACSSNDNGGKTTSKADLTASQAEYVPSVGYEEGTKMIAIATAMGMRYCDDEASLSKPAVIEDILGWYCARQSYSGGTDYLTEKQAAALQHSLIPDAAPIDLSVYVADGIMEKKEISKGVIYKFPLYVDSYKGLFSNFEISTEYPENENGEFTVTLRDRELDSDKEVYTFAFKADAAADKDYPYVLNSLSLPKTSVSVQSDTETAPFTIDELFDANSASVLVNEHKTVKEVSKGNNGYISEKYYFNWNGHYVTSACTTYDGEKNYEFSYDNNMLNYSDAHYISEMYAGSVVESTEYDDVLPYFMMGSITDFKESADIYSFSIKSDMYQSDYIMSYSYEVNKSDLSVTKAAYTTSEGYEETTLFTYGSEVDTYGLTDGWDDNGIRKVTVISSVYDAENGQADGTETYEVPYNVEVSFFGLDDYFIYADSDYTKKYTYPGDGKDYTVYITNAAG